MNYKKIYTTCLNYLDEITPEGINIEDYFLGVNYDYQSLNDVFYRFTASARNYNMVPRVIGYAKRQAQIDEILCNYNYLEVLNKYKEVSALYDKFASTFNLVSNKPKTSIWYRWSNSIIDSAKFISKFKDLNDFNNFMNSFSYNSYTKATLPMFIEKEIKGMRFALACDTIKELGFLDYCKPDVHIKDVLEAIDGKKYDDYSAFVRMIDIANGAEVTPYKLDKIIWLICSGDYYLHNVKIPNHKTELINILKEEY